MLSRILLPLLGIACLAVPARADIYVLEATMTGDQSVPPVLDTGMSGSAVLTYDSAKGTIDVEATFVGLSIATFLEDGFHLHQGAPGEIGIVLIGLPVHGEMITLPDGSIVGYTGTDIEVEPGEEEPLLSNNTYVMVHTGTNPTGEIRGQVILKETVPVKPATWSTVKHRFAGPG